MCIVAHSSEPNAPQTARAAFMNLHARLRSVHEGLHSKCLFVIQHCHDRAASTPFAFK